MTQAQTLNNDAVIELTNVEFVYTSKQAQTVLHIPKWSVAKQEQVFLHGASGCGKSTLLNLLSGLLPVHAGQMHVLGYDLDKMNSRQRDKFRANEIGYVSQQFNLVDYLSAIDNIRLANHFAVQKNKQSLDDEIKSLLSTLNISAADQAKKVADLSVGQQQRVAIARALINKPKLLIADEPTSSLDQANRDGFMALLKDLVAQYEMTLVFVSHDLTLAQHFNRVEAFSDINQVGGL